MTSMTIVRVTGEKDLTKRGVIATEGQLEGNEQVLDACCHCMTVRKAPDIFELGCEWMYNKGIMFCRGPFE